MQFERFSNVREVNQNEIGACKIPIFQGSIFYKHALVDPDKFEDVSKFQWRLDPVNRTAFRELKTKEDGKAGRESLHRRVMGCKVGDNSIVKFRKDNKLKDERLDCRSSNLYFDEPRQVTKWKPEKYFPSNAFSFQRYMHKKHADSPFSDFLAVSRIAEYTQRRVRFVLDDEMAKDVSPSLMTEKLQAFFSTEFGFKGEVVVARQVKKFEAAPKVEPLPVVPAEPVLSEHATVEPKRRTTRARSHDEMPHDEPTKAVVESNKGSDALDFLKKLGGVFGVEVGKDTALEFCTFGIRQKNEVLKFSFSREKLEEKPAATRPII